MAWSQALFEGAVDSVNNFRCVLEQLQQPCSDVNKIQVPGNPLALMTNCRDLPISPPILPHWLPWSYLLPIGVPTGLGSASHLNGPINLSVFSVLCHISLYFPFQKIAFGKKCLIPQMAFMYRCLQATYVLCYPRDGHHLGTGCNSQIAIATTHTMMSISGTPPHDHYIGKPWDRSVVPFLICGKGE